MITTLGRPAFSEGDEDPCRKAVQGHLHENLGVYVDGMDLSMPQKTALAIELPSEGSFMDLGSGSGSGTVYFAARYPDLQVTGLDLDSGMIERARSKFQLPNLSWKLGDVTNPGIAPGSLSGAFYSSVLHHPNSFDPRGVRAVRQAISHGAQALAEGGVIVIRDFIRPPGPKTVVLELPADNGRETGPVQDLSHAALFERFAREFAWRQPYVPTRASRVGWRAYRLPLDFAQEFVLHRPYLYSEANYAAEGAEKYLYYTHEDFLRVLGQEEGLRVLSAQYIHNPWIVENRYRGHFRLLDTDQRELPFPATNYVVSAQKVGPDDGVRLVEGERRRISRPRFLEIVSMRDDQTGSVYQIARRGGSTLDLLPYAITSQGVRILAKQGFPRPLLQADRASPNLDGSYHGGYVVEPISLIVQGKPVGQAVEDALHERAGIAPSELVGRSRQSAGLYPSPGIVDERTTNVSVQLRAMPNASVPAENYSGFAGSGIVRSFDARQILESAQAGGTAASRLEISVYELLLELKQGVGKWIGEQIDASSQSTRSLKATSATTLLRKTGQERRFTQLAPGDASAAPFLEIFEGTFFESNSRAQTIAIQRREYVLPRTFSANVISSLPFVRRAEDGDIYVGLEERHLPAVQLHELGANLPTNPAWRLPREIANLDQAHSYAKSALSRLAGVHVRKIHSLGGKYFPTIGTTPEHVYPIAVEVDAQKTDFSRLHWVRLRDLVRQHEAIRDGHLRLVTLRLAHALGLLKP